MGKFSLDAYIPCTEPSEVTVADAMQYYGAHLKTSGANPFLPRNPTDWFLTISSRSDDMGLSEREKKLMIKYYEVCDDFFNKHRKFVNSNNGE